MSFILDALKKAEAEKAAGQPQALEQQVVANIAPPPRSYGAEQEQAQRRLLALILGGIAAVGLLGFAGYKLWPQSTPATQTASGKPLPAAVTTRSAIESPAPAPAAEAASAEVPGSAPAPAAPVEAEIYVAAENIPVKPEDAGAEAGNMDDLIGDEEAIDEPAPTEAETEPQPSAAEIAALSKPVTANKGKAKATDRAGVKRLRDMPPTFRSGFPPLTVEVHYYDDNPLRRFVIINGKKYRETDSLVEGPRVVEITVDGVILDQGGTKVVKNLPR